MKFIIATIKASESGDADVRGVAFDASDMACFHCGCSIFLEDDGHCLRCGYGGEAHRVMQIVEDGCDD